MTRLSPKALKAPWRVQWLQCSQNGKRSRPRVVDATAKPLPLSKQAVAVLLAAAPELFELVDLLADRADFLTRVLKNEHACFETDDLVTRAERLLHRIRWEA
jgi:hypothetical protein